MKAFAVVLCLAAAARAEADPQLLTYGGISSPIYSSLSSPFYSSLASPVGYNSPAVVYKRPEELKKIEYKTMVPSTYAINPLTAVLGPRYYAKSAENVEHVVAKREAEAEADPFLFYNTALPYGVGVPAATYVNPYAFRYGRPLAGSGLKTYSNDAISSKNYAGKNSYIAENAGAIHVAKREAEAEPEADPLLVYGAGYPYASSVRSYVPTVRSPVVYNSLPYNSLPYTNLAYRGLYY